MAWFHKLGYRSNPMDVRPNPNLVGVKEQEAKLRSHIHKEEICFINGLTGSGKTSLLYRIQKRMKNRSFVYLDAQDLPEGFNLEEELKKKRNFFDKLRLKEFPTKKPVLIIDEFQATDPRIVLEARSKWETPDTRVIKSIVIAQISEKLNNVSDAFKERLGNRVIRMPKLDEEDMKKIINRRLYNPRTRKNFSRKMTEEAKELVVACAGDNPRRLLEYTDMLFDFHHKKFGKRNPIMKKKYQITFHAAKEILTLNGVNVDAFKPHAVKEYESFEGARPFEDVFDKREQRILKLLILNGGKTNEEISKDLRISKSTLNKSMKCLKKKNAILTSGKKNRKTVWTISPQAKRLAVKE